MPTHEEALARYVDHFRERRDWRGLIELMEFALDNVRTAGASDDDVIRRLEEIAQLAELRLGDIPRAIDAWQRIAQLEPGSPKVAEALRRLSARAKMWEQLVTSLEQEVATGHSLDASTPLPARTIASVIRWASSSSWRRSVWASPASSPSRS